MTDHQNPDTQQTFEARKASDPVLEIRDTSVNFDMDRGKSQVLNEMNLDIQRQEILGIVGESGSGKSMLASALLDAVVEPGELTGDITYYPESGGEVELLEIASEELRELRWEEISIVFQGALSSFNPTMTIRDHFEETLKAHDVNMTDGMDRAHQLLSDVYLESDRVLDSYPHELSGGMKQRALIALSLVLNPSVLVMDEPTAALDLLMQRSIINLLQDLKKKYNLTLVFITHDLPLVANLADRLAVMYAFELVEIGPTKEIIKHSSHPYTRALLNSTPNLNTPREKMKPIRGESPDPVNVPVGCSYHPRCPLADESCTAESPGMIGVDDVEQSNHSAACFYWDQVDEEIPLSINEVVHYE
jgi:oligopeptide/dipeptide ABC transporter ATP-binding protein